MQRRSFLKTSSLALVGAGGIKSAPLKGKKKKGQSNLTLSLNAYSFNKPLLDGSMSLEELFLFAKKVGFAAVDLTAYYIPGYPKVPEDEILFKIKKMAFGMGMAISGTGVRNDFTHSDAEQLTNEINHVKEWTVAAAKLGAPHIRVFDGRGTPAGNARSNMKRQVINMFRKCANYASEYGVTVGFQNHNNFIKTTPDILEVMEAVESEWFGLMLDIGSVVGSDPYQDIEKLMPYAVSWQVKENVLTGNGSTPTDFKKLMSIIRQHQYQGYFPLETLGDGDPKKKVRKLYQKITELIG